MPNASHILEIALLLLLAFLGGCVGGYSLRRVFSRGDARKRRRVRFVQVLPPPIADPPLVVAPIINPIEVPPLHGADPPPIAAPLPRTRTSAQRLAALATEPEGELAPEPVSPLAAAMPVDSPEPADSAAVQHRNSEDAGEDEAMRAVEGGWTPRAAPPTTRWRIELPEAIEMAPSVRPLTAPNGLTHNLPVSDADVESALSAVRSAVAAASAAAEAAIAGQGEPAEPLVAPAPEAAPAVAPTPRTPFGKPAGLPAPRDGGGDDLRRIRGLTPRDEEALHALGIFHFDQIATWDRKGVVWLDQHLALKGRLTREKWVEQARQLAVDRTHATRALRH